MRVDPHEQRAIDALPGAILTTGIDAPASTAGNDTVNAYAAADSAITGVTTTLNAADAIDLKGGNDTLNLTIDTGGVAKITAIAGATLLPGSIQGVENFYVRNLDAAKTEEWCSMNDRFNDRFSDVNWLAWP